MTRRSDAKKRLAKRDVAKTPRKAVLLLGIPLAGAAQGA